MLEDARPRYLCEARPHYPGGAKPLSLEGAKPISLESIKPDNTENTRSEAENKNTLDGSRTKENSRSMNGRGEMLGEVEQSERRSNNFYGESIRYQVNVINTTDEEVRRTSKLMQHVPGSSNLNEEETNVLWGWLNDYPDVFALDHEHLGYNSDMPLRINTESNMPIYKKPYRIPAIHEKEVEKQLENMLAQNVIQPSKSPWNFPLVIVKKKDGSLRLCVDYRALNNITIKDKFPLPNIDESLLKMSGTRYFTSMDLKSGYWQVAMDPESIPKTAFSTGLGHFEFTVVPFGLTNAPSVFQRLMNYLFLDQLNSEMLVYLDDLILLGKDIGHHDTIVRRALSKLRSANLKVKLEKCRMLQQEVEYLGHIVSRDGVKPQPDKVKAIKNSLPPSNARELKSFLGLASYYRKFIPKFGDISKPLHSVASKDKFIWSDKQQSAWASLKNALSDSIILQYPDFQKAFILNTDASDTAVGGVLAQTYESVDKPLCYISRGLTCTEQNYSTYEKELLAVVFCLKKCRSFIYGHDVIVRSDHRPLIWLMKMGHREPNGRLARWIMTLQDFDVKIEYVEGKLNKVADWLSRPLNTEKHINMLDITSNRAISVDTIIKEQLEDTELVKVINAIKNDIEYKWPKKRPIAREKLGYINDMLVYITERDILPILPSKLRAKAVWIIHTDLARLHPGITETADIITGLYWWPGIHHSVAEVIQRCDICARNKPGRKDKMEHYPCGGGNRPWELVHMDLIGPLMPTDRGNHFILVVIDSFSKYMELCALPSKGAVEVANAWCRFIMCKLGVPKRVVSDQGKEFYNKIMESVAKEWQIDRNRTSAYHPSSNGKVERVNRDIMIKLRIIVEELHRDWDEVLEFVQFSANIHLHRGTGYSPFYLMYGRVPRVPSNMTNSYTECTTTSPYDANAYAEDQRRTLTEIYHRVNKSLNHYNKEIGPKELKEFDEMKPEGLVYIDVPRPNKHKLQPKFDGPYLIVKQKTPVSYQLQHLITGHEIVVNKAQIRKSIPVVRDEANDKVHRDVETTEEARDRLCYLPTLQEEASEVGETDSNDVHSRRYNLRSKA